MSCLIKLYNSNLSRLLIIRESFVVSGRPPLLLIITAHPLLAASKLVLPKGSSHLEQTTAMDVILYSFWTNLWF